MTRIVITVALAAGLAAAIYALGWRDNDARRDQNDAQDRIETMERIEDALDNDRDLDWHNRLHQSRE